MQDFLHGYKKVYFSQTRLIILWLNDITASLCIQSAINAPLWLHLIGEACRCAARCAARLPAASLEAAHPGALLDVPAAVALCCMPQVHILVSFHQNQSKTHLLKNPAPGMSHQLRWRDYFWLNAHQI